MHKPFNYSVLKKVPTMIESSLIGCDLGHVRNPAGSSDAVTFDQKTDDQGASVGNELSHKPDPISTDR